MKGILLDKDDDLKVENGTLKVGERKMQDAYIVLSINQGEIKTDPVVGSNLAKMIRGGEKREKIRKVIEVSLERIGIKFDEIRHQFDLFINKNKIM
jgi:predicted Ser/Thr protein kinase